MSVTDHAFVAPVSYPSRRDEDLEAADFILKEQLTKKRYSGIQLADFESLAVVRMALRETLPPGPSRIEEITNRIDRALGGVEKLRRGIGTSTAPPASPKRPRHRRTLDYDYRSPVAPSKAVENTISLSEETLDASPNPEELLLALETRQGSEADDARLEAIQATSERLRLKMPLQCILEGASEACSSCDRPIGASHPRSAILRVDRPTSEEIGSIESIAILCEECRDKVTFGNARQAPPEVKDAWQSDLSTEELQAHQLRVQGLSQTEIGRRMTPYRSQAAISRILKKVDGKRETFRRERLRSTGGA